MTHYVLKAGASIGRSSEDNMFFELKQKGMSEIKTVTVRPYRVPSLNTALIITLNTNKMLNISA